MEKNNTEQRQTRIKEKRRREENRKRKEEMRDHKDENTEERRDFSLLTTDVARVEEKRG